MNDKNERHSVKTMCFDRRFDNSNLVHARDLHNKW